MTDIEEIVTEEIEVVGRIITATFKSKFIRNPNIAKVLRLGYMSVPDISKLNAAKIKCEEILRIVSEIEDVRMDALSSRTRKRDVVEARQIFCWLCKKHTKASLESIGTFVRRDHSTAIHSVKIVNNLMSVSRELRDRVAIIDNIITGWRS